MSTTTDTAALAAEHDNFGMFTDEGGQAIARLVLTLRAEGITHRRGEVLHPAVYAGIESIGHWHAEATDTAVRESIAYAIAAPASEQVAADIERAEHEVTAATRALQDALAALNAARARA